MARWDFRCDKCDTFFEDVEGPIGHPPERCPQGHAWERLLDARRIKLDSTFKGYGSLSPQMEAFWATGDPEVFPAKPPAEDAFTLDDLTDHQIETNQYG